MNGLFRPGRPGAAGATGHDRREEANINTTYHHIRVTDQDGCLTGIEPVPCATVPLWARDVAQEPVTWAYASDIPFFAPPIPFVVPPAADSGVPFYSHNHCPAITWLPNGDLLACWFSTIREEGTEMTILASRLRAGLEAWDAATAFFKVPNCNMTGTSLIYEETPTEAEHEGYLAATQSPDGVIHLISSRLYYRFNLAWLTA